MGYRRMSKEDVYEILRRWHRGQSVSRIAEVEQCDRKTIQKYIQKFNAAGLRMGKPLPDTIKTNIAHNNKRPPAIINTPPTGFDSIIGKAILGCVYFAQNHKPVGIKMRKIIA